MSLLASLATDDSITQERDSVGGSGAVESGLHALTVALAYITKADSGAMGLVLNLKGQDGQEVRSTQWMTSGTAKGGKNFYERNGEKHYLPGFLVANHLALLTVGKEISQLDTEEKVVKVWSSAAKAEVPTKVQMVMDLVGKEILAGIIKQTVDKTAKNDVTGEYIATGDTRDENEIDKLFRMRDRMTVTEIKAQATEASFVDTWSAKWTGKTRNRATGKAGSAGTAGAPAAASAAKKPTTSLFS